MRGAQLGLLVVAAIVAIVIGFIIAIMDACLLLHKNNMCKIAETKVQCMEKFKGKKECLSLTLKIINACFLIWAVVVSAKSKNFFGALALENCLTMDINLLLQDFSQQVNAFVYKKNLNALISFIVAMVLTLLKWLYSKISKKKDGAPATPAAATDNSLKPGQVVPMNNVPTPAKPGQTPMVNQPTPPMAPMGMSPTPPMQPQAPAPQYNGMAPQTMIAQ
jgi:hypothetical protein